MFGIISSIIEFLSSSLDFLAPLFAAIVTVVSWYFGKLTKGLAVITSNMITLSVIVPLMLGSGYYSHYRTIKKCEQTTVKKLRKDYKFVPKKVSTSFDLTNPLSWWK